MKTKSLLMTMVLPALFAACTSDEFEQTNENGGLGNRPVIGKVTFNLDGGAQTRWDAETLGPENNDAFGAALVDTWDGQGNGPTHYNVVNYIQTNSRYVLNGRSWESDANLMEGNYVFYAPFSVTHRERKPIAFRTPVSQKLGEVQMENGTVYSGVGQMIENEDPFYIDYKFLAYDRENLRGVNLSLKGIFAYPHFFLENNKGEDVTITRVLVASAGGGIAASGDFDNAKVVAELGEGGDWDWPSASQQKVTWKIGHNVKTTDLLADVKNQKMIRADLPEGGVTIRSGEKAEFEIVMPAMEFAAGDLVVYFVDNTGRKGYTLTNDIRLTLLPECMYPAEEYNLLGDEKGAKGEKLKLALRSNDEPENVPFLVTTTEELEDVIDHTPAGNDPLEVTVYGDDVKFRQHTRDLIAEKLSQEVIINGEIRLVGGSADDPLVVDQKITFDTPIVESGYVTFNSPNLGWKKVTVEAGAQTRTVTDPARLTIENYNVAGDGFGRLVTVNAGGTAVIKKKVFEIVNNENGTVEMAQGCSFERVTNAGTVDVTGSIAASREFVMTGTWNVKANGTMSLQRGGHLRERGTLTVESDGTFSGGSRLLIENGAMHLYGTNTIGLTLCADGEDERAELYLYENAREAGGVHGNADSDGNKGNPDHQFVYVYGSNVFLNAENGTGQGAIKNVNAKWMGEGAAPEQCNVTTVNGGTGDLGTDKIVDLTVQGNVTGKATIKTAESGKVTLEGNIVTSGSDATVTIENAKVVEITGKVDLTGTELKADQADTLVINGSLKLLGKNSKLTLKEGAILKVKGGITANSTDLQLNVKALYLNGSVTVSDSILMTKRATICIYDGDKVTLNGKLVFSDNTTSEPTAYDMINCGGGELTISSGSEIRGVDSKAHALNFSAGSDDSGRVYNYGTVKNAKAAFHEGGIKWWFGNAATRPSKD